MKRSGLRAMSPKRMAGFLAAGTVPRSTFGVVAVSWGGRGLVRAAAGPDAATVDMVLARCCRDGVPCCEVCGLPLVGERGVRWALHHRWGRGKRPGVHAVSMLLAVHGASNVDACHGRIHGSRLIAQACGWSVSRNGVAHPADVPVLIDGGTRRVLFTEDGRYVDVDGSDLSEEEVA